MPEFTWPIGDAGAPLLKRHHKATDALGVKALQGDEVEALSSVT
jgi:hypothetical protein